ncbi:MAG: sn-glycerol-3-phosphate ABC transporter ATP-binding protein UgpC [Cyanobacteria bacterium J06642_2]
MASVVFDRVSKQYGDVFAVKDLSLAIADREFLVLVGPSGCGKTTSLRMLAGLESATQGEIRIGDRYVNDLPAKDRDIAMVFQSYALYPHMSVYENMAFGLQLRGMPKSEIQQRVQAAATQLGIEALLHRKPKALSGGQRQRVAVGRAIVRNPAVFLMDEPLSNLDAKLRVQARAELSKLHRDLNATFVYVTHDQVEAMTMGTRIAVLNGGMLQQVDTPQNLYSHPKNVFVAGFIGSPAMNFFEGTLRRDGETLSASTSSFELPISIRRSRPCQGYVNSAVIIGIRPENIYDPKCIPPGIRTIPIEATVTVIEQMGSEIVAYLVTPDGVDFVARVDRRSAIQVGQTIRLAMDSEQFHFFDRQTEYALA